MTGSVSHSLSARLAWCASSSARIVSLAALACALTVSGAGAETIGGALQKAYLSNPDINQQRAAVRASDEGVPKANGGYLPTISAEAA